MAPLGTRCLCVLAIGVWLTAVASPAAAACPNEAIRVEQRSTSLPECRAYEQVSPVEKGGVDVFGDTQRPFVKAAPGGGALAYSSSTAFGNPVGAAYPSIYRAVRGPSGWVSSMASPPQDAGLSGGGGIAVTSSVNQLTDDLTQSIVATNHQLAPGATPGVMNLYRRDYLNGGYQLITLGGPSTADFLTPHVFSPWATPDLSSVLVESEYPLTSDAPVGPFPKLYVAHAGGVELASVLPNEEPSGGQAGDVSSNGTEGSQNAISADGSRVFFGVAIDNSQTQFGLFVRDLSSQTTTEIVPTSELPVFTAASADGSKVIYSLDGTYHLYDVATGTDRTVQDDAPGTPEVKIGLAASDDLSSFYFLASTGSPSEEELEENQKATEEGKPVIASRSIYRWQPEQARVTLVARLRTSEGLGDLLLSPGGSYDFLPTRRDVAQTADGSTFVFATTSRVRPASGPGYDPSSPSPLCHTSSSGFEADRCREVYVYDAPTDDLECASCPAGPPTAMAGLASASTIGEGTTGSNLAHQSAFAQARAVTADGSKVFFETGEQLVAADVNGRDDVYLWDKEEGLKLLSTGTSQYNARFLDASASGDDVFIVTRARLVGQDADELADVYDVTVGGGYPQPAPPVAPCQGEGCRGPSSSQSAAAPPVRSDFAGPGNKKERKRIQRAKKRQKKKHHKKKTRSAGAKRRASR